MNINLYWQTTAYRSQRFWVPLTTILSMYKRMEMHIPYAFCKVKQILNNSKWKHKALLNLRQRLLTVKTSPFLHCLRISNKAPWPFITNTVQVKQKNAKIQTCISVSRIKYIIVPGLIVYILPILIAFNWKPCVNNKRSNMKERSFAS